MAENVAFGLKVKRLGREERNERVTSALTTMQLAGLAERRPAQLSGGQRQRVALARALVNRPHALLLDEPLGALDLKLRKEMQAELKEVHRATGTTFLYVTHDQEEALTMSDRIAVMRDGRVEQLADPRTLYEKPTTAFVADFIGTSNLLVLDQPATVESLLVVGLGDGERLTATMHDAGDGAPGADHGSPRADRAAHRPRRERSRDPLARSAAQTLDVVYCGSTTHVSVAIPTGERLVMHQLSDNADLRGVERGVGRPAVVGARRRARHRPCQPSNRPQQTRTRDYGDQSDSTAGLQWCCGPRRLGSDAGGMRLRRRARARAAGTDGEVSGELRTFTYADTVHETKLANFKKNNPDVDVRTATFESNDEAAAKIKAGFRADVIEVCLDEQGPLIDAGMLAADRHLAAGELGRPRPDVPRRSRCGGRSTARSRMVPTQAGAVGIIYDKDEFPDGVDLLADAVRPRVRRPGGAGRRILADPVRDHGAGQRQHRPDEPRRRRGRRDPGRADRPARRPLPGLRPVGRRHGRTCSSPARS